MPGYPRNQWFPGWSHAALLGSAAVASLVSWIVGSRPARTCNRAALFLRNQPGGGRVLAPWSMGHAIDVIGQTAVIIDNFGIMSGEVEFDRAHDACLALDENALLDNPLYGLQGERGNARSRSVAFHTDEREGPAARRDPPRRGDLVVAGKGRPCFAGRGHDLGAPGGGSSSAFLRKNDSDSRLIRRSTLFSFTFPVVRSCTGAKLRIALSPAVTKPS